MSMYSYNCASAVATCVAALLVASGMVNAADQAQEPGDVLQLELLQAPSGPAGLTATMFTRLDAERTGVDFQIDVDENHPMRRLYEIAFAGAGIAIGDYDNDGRPDLFMTHHGGGNRLYRQVDDFVFEDVSAAAGISSAAIWSAGTTFADVNNDSYLDLYVNNYDAPNSLYINHQDGTFSEEAESWGLDYRGASVMAAFADYDRDGDLDMYLLTSRLAADTDSEYRLEVEIESGPGGRARPRVSDAYREFSSFVEKPNGQFEQVATGQRDILFRNDNGRFTPVALAGGASQSDQDDYHMGMSVVWWDFNGDQWPDIYVANDLFGPDRLYRNNGDGSFTDVIGDVVPHTPWFSMGSDFADINNDGLLDFIATDMSATTHYEQKVGMGDMDSQTWFLSSATPRQYMRNALYLNTGTDRFMEIAHLAGVSSTDWTWSAKLNDYDNDGFVDLFISNGMVRNFMDADAQREIAAVAPPGDYWEILKDMPPKRDTNLAFRNTNGLLFDKVGEEWGLDHKGLSFGAAVADIDRDGDLDLIVNNLNEPVSIYRNDSQQGHRLLVRLVGDDSNSAGLGATVRIETPSGIQVRQLSPARGFMSADEAVIHFGLGSESRIERLTVSWPSGRSQSFADIPAGNLLTISEHGAETGTPAATPVVAPMYENVSDASGLAFHHRELPFDDYHVQPLLPAKLSQLGPGIAWGDIDNDGDDDVFVGGAAGQAGTLYINRSDGHFLNVSGPWLDHESREDMAALWIDVDGDGFLDLYIGSGSVEFEQGDPGLADRLYLNNGDGSFRHAPPGSLPQAGNAGAALAAADFDGDGDLDLFIGGRVVPGEYPLSPDSQLLRNDGGRFTDVTDEFAPALRKVGLVTGALWSDVDDDGDVDLFVTLEWGPVRLFRNDLGRLADATAAAGLGELSGWWNGITSIDIDNDGDLDYVVTNAGLNTKYDASIDKPAILYYGDFGGAAGANLIEAQWEDETVFPVRGLSCSSNAMPFIAAEFSSFDSFASADIEQLFSSTRLDAAADFLATELRSGMLINAGDGTFAFQPLPLLAQVAPAFGVVSGDFDLDGNADVYLVHNSYSPQAETGRMDGGVSVLLLGDGRGALTPVWPNRSGLSVGGDSKALTTTDLDQDGQADFLISRNDDTVQVYRRNNAMLASGRRPLAIRLRGDEPNPSGVGAKVTVVRRDGSRQAAEIHAGAGYLSQSAPVVFFANTSANPIIQILVRWPAGGQTSYEPEDGPVQVIRQAIR